MKHGPMSKMAACVLGAVWVWSGFAQAAGAPAWPAAWTAFGPVPPAAGTAGRPNRDGLLPGSALASIPETLEIGGQSYKGQPVSPDAEGRFDLGSLFGGVERGKTVYLLAPLKAEQAATLSVGAGADWWMQWWLDGAPVFDTLATGNQKAPVTAANHAFDLALAPGDHVLAVATISGSQGYTLAAGPAGGAGTGYAEAMADGRAQAGRYKSQCITAAIGAARTAFETAGGLATNDTERAAALLALADAWLADRLAGTPAAARSIYEQVPGLEGAWSRYKGQAMLGIGETWRREGQYARAREAYAQASKQSAHPSILQAAACATARAYLREGNAAAARAELEPLLALEWHERDQHLKEDPQALLEIVSLTELWRRGPAAEPAAAAGPGSGAPGIEMVVRGLRRARPRLFLTPELLDRVQSEGLTDWQREWLAALKQKVDGYAKPPELDAERQAHMLSDKGGGSYGGGDAPRIYDGPWGYCAAHAALVYRLTGERAYYDRALEYLRAAAAEWDLIRAYHRIPMSRCFVKINALAAYDWLYADMPPAERAALGSALVKPMHAFYWYWRRMMGRPQRKPYPYRLGKMSYGDNNLGWYLGLVFTGEDIEGLGDEECLELLRDEYDQYVGYFRDEVPPPDGVKNEGAPGYYTQKLGVKVNFLDSWRSAMGDNFARYVPLLSWFGTYTLWNSIDPLAGRTSHSPGQLHYGWGDAYHDNNSMGIYHHPPLMRLADLYGGLGSKDDLRLLAAIGQAQAVPDYRVFMDTSQYLTPASPLWMTPERLSDEDIHAALARLPRARYLPSPVGHLFMNSGWGSNDTYAMFIAGRRFTSRKHYDENHFTIYKKGFLAMDTGARGAGYDPAVDGPAAGEGGHGVNYYYDTIAHNGVLIHMEGEQLPGYWGQKASVNTGGMNQNYGAHLRAFETDALYTYVASDATSCYHSNKAAEVVRQFLFVYPDWFVVFDRVESKAPDQKKTWLFHTQMEPVETGDTFRAEHRDGAVCVRTLLPLDRKAEKIGGPGKEFWAGGRNWPLNKHMTGYMVKEGQPTPERNLFGQWRMEILPEKARARDLFLHLIEVGDKAALTAMTPSMLIEDDRTAGVEFQAGARTVRVVFHTTGDVGGQIRITEGETVLADRPLATSVLRQEGLALVK